MSRGAGGRGSQAARLARGLGRRLALLLMAACVAGGPCAAVGGPSLEQQPQVWFGYMSQLRLTRWSSIWNDAHFVPDAFYVLRTGYTFHALDSLSVTAGYGFLGLPVGGVTRDLKRVEHRPWGQVVHGLRLAPQLAYTQRLRYDARFRRNVGAGGLEPGFSLTHRVRGMVNLRYAFGRAQFGEGFVPYVSLGNELLLNFASHSVSLLDQNRVSLMVGMARGGLQVQIGYMNRLVRLPSGSLIMNHTPVIWVFHTIDARRPDAEVIDLDPLLDEDLGPSEPMP